MSFASSPRTLRSASPDFSMIRFCFRARSCQREPLVLRMVRVLLKEVIPNDLARSLLIRIAEFPSEFGGVICSHASECKPQVDHAKAMAGD